MLGYKAAYDPIVVHFQRPLPQATDLSFGINSLCSFKTSRDVGRIKGVRLLCLEFRTRASQNLSSCGPYIFVRKASVSNHGICIYCAAIWKTKSCYSKSDRLGKYLHSHLALCNYLCCTRICIMSSTSPNEIVHEIYTGSDASRTGKPAAARAL